MIRRALARITALVIATASLCGCPPDEPAVGVVGVSSSRTADGRSRLTATLANGGYDDFDGDVCFRVTWLKDAVFELRGADFVRKSGEGEVVEEARSCHGRREIKVEAQTNVDLESQGIMPAGTFAVIVLEPTQTFGDTSEERIVSAD